jgi:hypothetical protein
VGDNESRHQVSVTVSVSIEALRCGLDLVEGGAQESFDALVESLLLDGRAATSGLEKASASPLTETEDSLNPVLHRPTEQPAAELTSQPSTPRGSLLFLTNRLNPLKLSARVLANLAREGDWPELREFQLAAARAARGLGQRLRAEDKEAGRRGAAKRFVGYPVGDDQDAAFGRFIFSFTIEQVSGRAAGPLAVLGLADVVDGRAVLTESGWRLAAAPGPLLDGGDGILAREEIVIFRERLRAAPDEREAIAEFLAAVHRAAGAQPRVDEVLSTWHKDWSSDRAAAHRAAMLGRLGELRVLRVTGRGGRAQIELLDTSGFDGEKGKGA